MLIGSGVSANRSSISANRLGVLAATAALGAAPQSCNTSRGLGSCCLSSGAAATRRQCGGLSSRENFLDHELAPIRPNDLDIAPFLVTSNQQGFAQISIP